MLDKQGYKHARAHAHAAGHTHTQKYIFFAFPRQQWFVNAPHSYVIHTLRFLLSLFTTHNRNIYTPGGIQTPNLSKRWVADRRLRELDHWNRQRFDPRNRPARSESLYRLSYPGPRHSSIVPLIKFNITHPLQSGSPKYFLLFVLSCHACYMSRLCYHSDKSQITLDEGMYYLFLVDIREKRNGILKVDI
jgi:hypothetical protein